MLQQADLTGTFKQRKLELQSQGFDPGAVDDPLYLRDEAALAYLPLTPERFARIQNGSIRL